MTQEHPITPPEELVDQWNEAWIDAKVKHEGLVTFIATQAAHWGADQELMAYINYFHEYDPSWGEDSELITGLRAARRPKPPNLKELALEALNKIEDNKATYLDSSIVRRALEQLND